MHLLFIFFFALLSACGKPPSEGPSKPKIFVSIAPFKFFAERIAGDHLEIRTIVPTGVSAHTYEPSPRETASLEKAEIWFQIGDSFEKKISPVLLEHTPELELVDMRQGIPLIASKHPCHGKHCDHDHSGWDGSDNHIWLSPKLAKQQAQKIADVFAARYPQFADEFYQNLSLLQKDLEELDVEIDQTLSSVSKRAMLVSHPAFAYFCQDYGFKQLSVEFDGKDPLPQQMEELLANTQKEEVSIVLMIPQYNNKGAKLISQHLHLPSETVDPYAENYIENLRQISKILAK